MKINLTSILKKRSKDNKFTILILLFFIFNLFFLLPGTVFAQSDNSEKIPSVKDGLREQYTDEIFKCFLKKK